MAVDAGETHLRPGDSQDPRMEHNPHLPFFYTVFYPWLCLATSSLHILRCFLFALGYEFHLENTPAFLGKADIYVEIFNTRVSSFFYQLSRKVFGSLFIMKILLSF